jgi:hypothetical protein
MEVTKKLREKGIIASPRFESVRMSPRIYDVEKDVPEASEEPKKMID